MTLRMTVEFDSIQSRDELNEIIEQARAHGNPIEAKVTYHKITEVDLLKDSF